MGKFVRIQATRPIVVTGGLQTINATNLNSNQTDRLNVKPMWMNIKVRLTQGTGYYPACVAQWTTVKVLEEKEILTVGAETDDVPEKYRAEAEKLLKSLTYEIKKYEKADSAMKAQKKAAKKKEVKTVEEE